MQDVENFDVIECHWWCGIVVMNVAYAVYRLLCDVRYGNDAMCCQMWWCNAMWNMVWCEICYDVECGCGVE